MHIGQKIKALRELKCWTQVQLAEVSNLSDRTIRRIEANGKPDMTTLQYILRAFEITLEQLNNMFNEDETIKNEEKEKFANTGFLHRVESGRDLIRIISSAHQYGYDYHDCETEEQIENVQTFLL